MKCKHQYGEQIEYLKKEMKGIFSIKLRFNSIAWLLINEIDVLMSSVESNIQKLENLVKKLSYQEVLISIFTSPLIPLSSLTRLQVNPPQFE